MIEPGSVDFGNECLRDFESERHERGFHGAGEIWGRPQRSFFRECLPPRIAFRMRTVLGPVGEVTRGELRVTDYEQVFGVGQIFVEQIYYVECEIGS